jgi:anti-anti-sigma regulatory factor
VTPDERPQPTALLRVEWIDDPAGDVRLVSLRGDLNPTTTRAAAAQIIALSSSASVHIDLSGAEIDGPEAMTRLEAMADLLEDRGVNVHIVGIDPMHPALVSL